jgi:hypothetical protein
MSRYFTSEPCESCGKPLNDLVTMAKCLDGTKKEKVHVKKDELKQSSPDEQSKESK